MKARKHTRTAVILAISSVLMCAIPVVYADFKWWEMPQGSAEDGPGAGMGGVASSDVPNDTAKSFWASLLENVEKMVNKVSELQEMGPDSNEGQMKEFQKSVGVASEGIQVEKYTPAATPTTADYLTRCQMLEQLKNSQDAEKYSAFISHQDAMQAQESRLLVFDQRLNALIESNNQALNWQQRNRLATELNLLNVNYTSAAMDMQDRANMAKITAAQSDAEEAAGDLERKETEQRIKLMIKRGR